jgi:hypothetical protein
MTRLDTTPDPPVFPPQKNIFQKLVRFVSDMGSEFGGKKGEKPSEKPQPQQDPKLKLKPKPITFHCDDCGRDGHKEEFCFRKRMEERFSREMAKMDRYCPSCGVPEPRVVPRSELWCITFLLD